MELVIAGLAILGVVTFCLILWAVISSLMAEQESEESPQHLNDLAFIHTKPSEPDEHENQAI